ncbi:MAG: fatty acid desaturase [Planctomycetota bacterium]
MNPYPSSTARPSTSQPATSRLGRGASIKQGLLARPEDAHCVAFHLLCLVAYGSAWWLWCHPESWLAGDGTSAGWLPAGWGSSLQMVAFVLPTAFLLGWISGIDVGVNFHNHTHRQIFRRPGWNRWFARLWTFSGGWPAAYWQYAHVRVHHHNLLGERDWTLPKLRPDGRFESLYVYALCHWPWRYAWHFWQDVQAGRFAKRVALREGAWFLLFWSIPFWIDPWMGLWLWALPQWLGNCITMASGMYVQHAGCVAKTAEHPVQHSNGFLSPFFNLTMFNIGYHVEHHDYPGVHWADLPAFHQEHRVQLVADGAHYVPYGYYRAASMVAAVRDAEQRVQEFCNDTAPGYLRSPTARETETQPESA